MEQFDSKVRDAYENFSTPSYRLNVGLKITRFYLRMLGRISPARTQRKVRDWFFSPMKSKPSSRDLALYGKAVEQRKLALGTGVEFQSYVWGDGDKTVVLGHGWESRATHMRAIIKGMLSSGYRVVAYDAPAHGQSGGTQSDIVEFRDMFFVLEQNYGPFYGAIGHSLGGLALVNALRSGLAVERAVIIAAPVVFSEAIYKFARILDLPEKLHQSLRGSVEQHFDGDTSIWSRFTAYHDVSSVKQSCLVVHDAGDEEVLIIEAECLAQALPRAELMVTEGLGHVKILRSEDVVKRIVGHLA